MTIDLTFTDDELVALLADGETLTTGEVAARIGRFVGRRERRTLTRDVFHDRDLTARLNRLAQEGMIVKAQQGGYREPSRWRACARQ